MANLKLGVTIGGSVAIHASNYNNYAPTLTGGNASGTWGINITGNSATTSQTNFSSLTINGAAVATQAYVTGLGYLTSFDITTQTDPKYLRSDTDDAFAGNLTSNNGGWIKFYAAAQTDDNDGKIGSGMFGSGLNIVGSQTTAGNGREVRIWGSLITSGGDTYWHSGNFTNNSSNWDSAYNDKITAISVSSGPTKTITLTQQDGGTLTASFSDIDTDTNTYLTNAAFNTSNGILTLTRSDSGTVTVDLDGRFYTQAEADGRYVNVTGDVMTGALGISTSTAGIDSFYVDGTYGRLFTVTDDLTDAVFSVNTISGLPIIEAYSDYSVKMGRYGQNDLYVSPTGNVGFGNASPSYKVDITGSLRLSGTIYAGGYIEQDGISMNLRRVNSITFAPNNTWDHPYNHGIMSTDLDATNSDSISINSWNDIILRIDSNANNNASYVRFMNDSAGNNQFAYIGWNGSNYESYFSGITYTPDMRAYIFYDYNDTNYYLDPNSSSVLYSTNINRAQITNDLTTSSGQGRFGGWYTGTGYTGAAVEVGFSGGNGYVIAYNRNTAAYQPLIFNGSNIYLNPVSGSVYINTSPIIRQSAGTGWLSGNYASSETSATTGAIYSIGGSYYPTSTSLNTMYGVGYTHTDQGAMPTGANSWGFYVAGNGVARVWLGGDNGNIIATGNIYAETNRIVATQAWVSAQGYITSETDSQTLNWDGPNKNLSITNGNTVTLDGLATEEFVTSQGYLTSLPSHNHDDRYYTETEIGNFFSGSSVITGYNKSNWDTAFGWGNHASAGYQAASTAITTSNIGSQSVSYATSAGNADTVDSVHAASFVRNDVSQPTVQRHFDASTTWTNDAITLFLGWYGGKVVIGNNNEANHDNASALGGNTVAITNTLYSFEQSNLYYDGSLKLYMGSDGTRNTGWAYHTNNGTGLHWPNNGWHLMPASTADFRIYSGSGSESALRFETSGTIRGYVYANSSNEIGFLNNDRTWRLRVYPGGAVESYGDFRAPIFYDSDDTNYYLNPNGTTNIWRLQANDKYHYFGSSSNWDSGSLNGENSIITNVHFQGHPDFWIGAGNTKWYTGVVSGHHDLLINTMQSGGANTRGITFTATSSGASAYRLGRWFAHSNQAGSYLQVDGSIKIGATSDYYSAPTAKLHVTGSTSGADVFAVDGINGRLFTVTDDLSDSLFSVNTIAGLPIIEVFANNKVTIGKYGANSITIDNSRIAINSDTVDTNFPFYVGDRSTAGSRYILANPGMGFNLADNYAQLQLYGTSGAYLDFVTSAVDSAGRIMWNGNFIISGDTYFNNTLYTYTLYDRNDTNYYLDMNGTSRLGTVNANELRSYGNTYLGDGNGDETHINDVLRIGATDSGDAHIFFGEGGSAGSDYGAHLYWDSGYTFYWYTRNAGTDRTLFTYTTNDTTYLYWYRHFHMQNYEINYVSQLHFNAGTRFAGNDTHYLNFKTDAADYGSIQVRDGNNTLRGYLGYFDGNGFGILSADGSWAARATNSEIELYHITLADDMRANIYYDRNNTNYYLDPTSNTALRTVGSWRADSADWDGEFAGKIQYHVNSWYLQARDNWYFRNEGGENVMTGDSAGNFTINGILTENSSLRYKENIQDFAPALDKVEKLRPVTYNKIGQDQLEVGLIAEEVAELYPEVVNYDELGRPDGINYTRLSVILLKSLQELNDKIKKLES